MTSGARAAPDAAGASSRRDAGTKGSAGKPAWRILAAAILSNALGVLPIFLLGALAVLVRRDLGFGEIRLGLAVAVFSAASALVSVGGGRLAERVGPERAMMLGAVASAGCMVGIAVFATSWGLLAMLLALGGVANAVAQPGTNLALARAIPTSRQGLAYGAKQASVPLAILLAGAAVPALGLTVGWRACFAGGTLIAVVFAVVVPRPGPAPAHVRRRVREGDAAARPLVVLAVAAGFGAAAANSMGAFYVESAVTGGLDGGAAGLWLAAGGACGVTARLLWGWRADQREGGHLRFVALLLLAGAGGYVLLALGGQGLALAMGTVLAFSCGWGWPGLFNFAVVRQNRNAPAAATGITQTGVFAGALVGPPLFGLLVEQASYRTAWLAAATLLVIAAGLIRVGRQSLVRDIRRRG